MNSLTLLSPAKVNLFLKVLGRRPDGYHNLFTLFHRLSLADTLTLKKIPSGIRIRTNVPGLPVDSRNLIWKAFRLLQDRHPFKGGVSVRLCKRIPIGAGLGGGSSNAAFFLLGMNRLFGLKLTQEELGRLGAALGSDVNFFLSGFNQVLGFGRGEVLKPVPRRKKLWFVVVSFAKHLSTAVVYGAYRGPRRGKAVSLTKENTVVRLRRCLHSGKIEVLKPFLENDLQEVSMRFYPPIGKTLERFRQWGVGTALMSGSGPTVFAVFSSACEARRAAGMIRRKSRLHRAVFVSHTF